MTRLQSNPLPASSAAARTTERCPGAALLAVLDRALSADKALYRSVGGSQVRRPEGLAAAVALNKLLSRNRLGWSDVLAPGNRLAKICGLLGSDFPAEHEAAYTHALRIIAMGRSTWSALVSLPPGLDRLPDEDAASSSPSADSNPTLLAELTEPTPSAPEADWPTTVMRLKTRMAWRSDAERLLLDELDSRLANGEPIATPDARRLRDMWWFAELNDPVPEETTA